MESKSFIKLLRKIIREEVSRAVKEVLTESNINQVTKSSINLSETFDDPMPNRPVAKRKFTKNSMLNDILNETAATPPSQELTDWSTMNFRSEMAQSFGNERSLNKPSAAKGINGETINMTKPEMSAVQNALSRDYSGLIKAIDKKNGKMGTTR